MIAVALSKLVSLVNQSPSFLLLLLLPQLPYKLLSNFQEELGIRMMQKYKSETIVFFRSSCSRLFKYCINSSIRSTCVVCASARLLRLLEGKYLQKTYILQLGSVSQLVNVHHVRSLHMHHQIPGVSKRRLTVDTAHPLGASTFTTRCRN